MIDTDIITLALGIVGLLVFGGGYLYAKFVWKWEEMQW